MSVELSDIRDITREEHREFMEFLRMKTHSLFNHEVTVALDQGKTPKNSYQGIFHQSQCFIAEPNGNVKIFFAYTREFITFARQIFAKVTRMDPEIFNKDAYDVMKSFYEASNYALMNKTEEDYRRYISSDTCAYIAFKENGEFKDRIFRLDLYRQIDYNTMSKKHEFTGGLFHVLSHFRMDDSTHSDNILDLWHLVRVCSTAFVNRITPINDSTLELYLYWNNKYDLHFIFFREEESNVYYIKTFYVRERKERTMEENKKGLIDDKGEIIVPCKYDEMHFDENIKCYIFAKNETFKDKETNKDVSLCVKDMYSSEGEFIIGGFEEYKVISSNQIIIKKAKHFKSYIDGPAFSLLFVATKHLTNSYSWFFPLANNIAIYLNDVWTNDLGIITPRFETPAYYSYISKPFKGWCLGVGRMHSIPYEGKEAYGFCELINTQRNEAFRVILFKDLKYEKVEDLINRNILRILDIDEATSNTNSTPCITIPNELYEQGIINPVIKEKVRCGDSVRNLKNEKIFISSEELSRQRKEYLEYLCPRDIHVPDRTSPLVAFEGDGELYNDWLNS